MEVRQKVDPVLVAIITNRMTAIAEEMAQTLMMTSRSGIFAEARDFVTAIFDKDARLITQSEFFPGFAGALPHVLPPILEKFGDDIHDGDVFIENDPFYGNSHLPDLNIIKPMFWNGARRFWLCCKGHMADIGGGGVAGYDLAATTVWDEGLVIPPIKLYERGCLNRSLWDFILRNVRASEIVAGDIQCEVGGATIGERGLRRLLDQYGADVIHTHLDEFFLATEREMRERITAIPDGTYYGEKSVDNNVEDLDRPVAVRVRVVIDGSDVTLDFSESDPQTPRFMNSTDAFTKSMGTLTLFWIVNQSRSNYGSLRPIHFINPKGTCVNVEFPGASTLATCSMAECIQETIQLALAPALPSLIPAPSGKLFFPMFSGVDPRTGKFFVNLDFFYRLTPSGGTDGYDGWELGGPAQELGKGRTPDVEITELTYPVRVLAYEETADSAGAGKFRGGNGHVYRVQYLSDSEKGVVFGAGLSDFAVPKGLFGGEDPAPTTAVIQRGDGRVEAIRPNTGLNVKAGDVITVHGMGGPGFGEPLERDVELVRRDVRDGFVSLEKARRVYGVTFVPGTHQVDAAATERLRSRRLPTA